MIPVTTRASIQRGIEPDSQRPTTVAEQVQDAIDQGASLDVIRRHFHLSESELRDYCADIMDDGLDDPGRNEVSGYYTSGSNA